MTIMDLLKNNAKHFGSFGSDLPGPVLEQVVSDEHNGLGITPAELITGNNNSPFVGGIDNNPTTLPYRTSAYGMTPSRKAQIDYLNADLAKHYGMSKATAYQEALANTAYQRSIKDMQAAGLNPAVLYGSGRATPASASVYASSGGSSGRSSGRGSSSSDKLFSSSAYAAIQAIGGLIGIGVSKKPDGFWIGSQTAKGAMGLLDSIWKK